MARHRGSSLGESVIGLGRLTELAFATTDLSTTHYRLLRHLQRRGDTIQSDLAFQLSVSKQSVTRLVDGLVDRGLVVRREDPQDRRRVIHALTPRGERALSAADTIVERYLMHVLDDLDDDAEIDAARTGIHLFGQAQDKAIERVRPDGIVPSKRRVSKQV